MTTKTAYRTWVPNELVTAAMMNEQVRDNGDAIWVGTTAGDMDYYVSSTEKDRIPAGADWTTLTAASGVPTWTAYSAAYIYATGTQSINTGTVTTVTGYDVEAYDTDSYFTAADYKFTIPVDGLYAIVANVKFASHATGGTLRRVGLYLAGNTFFQDTAAIAGEDVYMSMCALRYLEAADNVYMRVQQNSGGALNISFHELTIARIK